MKVASISLLSSLILSISTLTSFAEPIKNLESDKDSFFITLNNAKTGWASDVTQVELKSNETVTVEGKLEDGKIIEDLSWASTSSNACFPATQNAKFRGNHVFFATKLPPRSILNVKVIPDDPNSNLSIYGYQIGTNSYYVVPELPSCVSCEAEHKWDRPKYKKTQDHTRSIMFNATTNSYNIFIGITGPKEAVSGSFKVEFELKQ